MPAQHLLTATQTRLTADHKPASLLLAYTVGNSQKHNIIMAQNPIHDICML